MSSGSVGNPVPASLSRTTCRSSIWREIAAGFRRSLVADGRRVATQLQSGRGDHAVGRAADGRCIRCDSRAVHSYFVAAATAFIACSVGASRPESSWRRRDPAARGP